MQYEWNGERPEGRKPYSKADGMQINFGTIYTPYNFQKINIELTMGGMYRYIKSNKFTVYNDYSQKPVGKDLSLYNRWVIQASVILNFKLKADTDKK